MHPLSARPSSDPVVLALTSSHRLSSAQPTSRVSDDWASPTGNISIAVDSVPPAAIKACATEKGLLQLTLLCGVFSVTPYNVTLDDSLAVNSTIGANFTLTSTAGPCTFAKGTFSCSAKTPEPSFFQVESGSSLISFNGTEVFSTPAWPMSPWQPMPILDGPGKVNVTLDYKQLPAV